MNSMTNIIVQLFPGRSTHQRNAATTAGIALLLMAAAIPASAQFFPTEEPVVVFSDDFSTFTRPTDGSPDTGIWNVMRWSGGNLYDGLWEPNNYIFPCAGGDSWLQHVRERIGRSYRSSVIAINQSMLGDPGYEPDQWTNIRFEVDFRANNEQTAMGVVLGGSSWDSPANGYLDVEGGYLFYIDHFPTKADARDRGERSYWHLVKRIGGTDVEIAGGMIELDPGNNDLLSVYEDQCYRLRIEFFCGNLRAQVKRFDCNDPDVCSYWDCGGEWCTIMEWTDPAAVYLTPGFAGLWSSGTRSDANGSVRFDNVKVSSWGDGCHLICGEWSTWSADWDSSPFTGLNGEEGRERFPFKLLYDGAVLDYSYGVGNDGYKIDIDSLEPTDSDPRNITGDGYCNGWNLLVDLPPPNTTSNVSEMQAFLEPMASAVDLLNDGTDLVWQDDFDPDPASATYNPIPIVTDGTTPIANSLWDAYDWYQESITTGTWSNDPLSACRQWYVVLITDGEESCGLNACDGDQAAWKFKVPDVGEPVRVFTIGFSEEFDPLNPSPLECVSTITDGRFFVATDASELTSALQGVIDEMDSRDRSFVPFQVTPPSSTAGSVGGTEDFLALYPFFVPRKDFSLWSGTMYAFKLNSGQPTLPVTGDCQIDFSMVEWDAATSLSAQLSLGTPLRNVYMGTSAASVWTRRDLDDVGTDATLRTEFKTRLGMPTLPTDLEAQEVVNFLTNIYDNPMGLSPAPQNPPRPATYPVLGDTYHSQPVVARPPNTSLFYYDYGFVAAGELGAHDYQLYMEKHAKRRRVALVGANDGMLHAFDAGFWDRDDGGTYDNQHDLGTGTELFAYVPEAISDKLWTMTYGTEQQYMVDGHIAVSDVFISPDGGVSPKEWRTVALASMRRGGRGIVALDVTEPDPTSGSPDYVPIETPMAGCADGTAAGCGSEFPRLMWEFSDKTDDDANCPAPLTGDDCAPYWDLGWTWSRPAIARVPVYNSSQPNAPDDVFIAFFGGGWDREENDWTGTHIYGVDIATGAIVYKHLIGVAVPGSFAAHDSDLDGFHDRIYFGDSDGSVWRIEFPAPNDPAATGVGAANLERIFDFRAGFAARQQFFTRPIIVPAKFDGANFIWALAMGAGDRANLQLEDGGINGFYFMLDSGTYATPRTAGDLVGIDYSSLTGDFQCADSALDPGNGLYGWYMTMRPNEKTTFEATVINGHVLFPTFEPGLDLLATDPPDLCGGSGGGGGGGGFGGPEPPDVDPDFVCRAAGIGRVYDLWFECGNGTQTELNDLPTGSEFYTIDGTTYVTHTLSGGSPGLTQEFLNPSGYTVTNWRQE